MDINLDGLSGKQGLLLWCKRCTKEYKPIGVDISNFHKSWKDGKAFAALVAHHRPDLVNMDDYGSDAAANLENIFALCEREFDIPRLIDVEDITEMPKPDEKIVITYVAFLFRHFASFQKTEAKVKAVKRALQIAARHSEWIEQYLRDAAALRKWIEEKSVKFSSDDHGSNLDEIKAAMNNFDEHRKQDKPEKRGDLTRIDGQLNTLNASCRNNHRNIYVPPKDLSIDVLDAMWHKLEELEEGYQISLQDAYVRFEKLEFALRQFNAKEIQVRGWCDSKKELFQSEDLGNSMAEVERKLDEIDSFMSQQESYSNVLEELKGLSEMLTQGLHSNAPDVQKRLSDLRFCITDLQNTASQHRANLQTALARHKALQAKLKNFSTHATELEAWCENVQQQVLADANVESGVGVDAIKQKQQSLTDEYTQQRAEKDSLLRSLTEDARALSDGGHTEATNVEERLLAISKKSATLHANASTYDANLVDALKRETTLQEKAKMFRAKMAKTRAWADGALPADACAGHGQEEDGGDDDGSSIPKGVGLTAVEVMQDEYTAKYKTQADLFAKAVEDMRGIQEDLTAANHADAEAAQQEYNNMSQQMEELRRNANAYEQSLLEAAQRERNLEELHKDFKDKCAKLDSWVSAMSSLVQNDDHGVGAGMPTVESRFDNYRAEYEAQKPRYDQLLTDITALSSKLSDGNFQAAADVSQRVGESDAAVSGLAVQAQTYAASLQEAYERESNLIAQHKEFASSAAKVDGWCENCELLIENGDVPSGAGVDAAEIKQDAFNTGYKSQQSTNKALLDQLAQLNQALVNGEYKDANTSSSTLSAVGNRVQSLNTSADNYENTLADAIAREDALVVVAKSFHSNQGKVESWIESCERMVSTPLPAAGCGVSAIEARADSFKATYETQVAHNRQVIDNMNMAQSKLLTGSHPDAAEAAQTIEALKGSIQNLQEKANDFSNVLADRFEMERALVDAFRLFKSEATKLESWLENCNGMVTGTGHGKGAGLEKVESMSDTFKAKYTSQLPINTKTVQDLSELAGELGAGGHSDVEKVQERLKNDTSQLEALKQQAAVYQEALEASLTREQQLVSSLKEFRAKASKVDSWIASIRAVVDSTDYEKGVGLAHIDDKLHTLQSEYDVQSPTFHNTLSDLASLADAIVEGQHADADATKAHFDDTNAKMTALDADAEAYQQRLNDAHAHERKVADLVKHFAVKYAKVEAWIESCDKLVSAEDHRPGCGLQLVETRRDGMDSDYTSQLSIYQNLISELVAHTEAIQDGQHPDAAEMAEQQNVLADKFEALEAKAVTYSEELEQSHQRERDLVDTHKLFNAKYAKLKTWIESVYNLIGVAGM